MRLRKNVKALSASEKSAFVNAGPVDPDWLRLPAATRDDLLGRALGDLARLATTREHRDAVHEVASKLMKHKHKQQARG